MVAIMIMISTDLTVFLVPCPCNEIVTSRDSAHDWDVLTLGISGNSLTPFPTLGVELGESDELVEESADKTHT